MSTIFFCSQKFENHAGRKSAQGGGGGRYCLTNQKWTIMSVENQKVLTLHSLQTETLDCPSFGVHTLCALCKWQKVDMTIHYLFPLSNKVGNELKWYWTDEISALAYCLFDNAISWLTCQQYFITQYLLRRQRTQWENQQISFSLWAWSNLKVGYYTHMHGAMKYKSVTYSEHEVIKTVSHRNPLINNTH